MLELVKPWPRQLPGWQGSPFQLPYGYALAMGWSTVAVGYHYSDQRTTHCEP